MAQLGFWNLAKENPSRIAVIGPDGRQISAGELFSATNRLVHGLRELGLQAGDTIAAVLMNEPAILELLLAATQAGWYITPINTHLTVPEIAYIVSDCEAKALVCSERYGETCRGAAKEIGFPEAGCFSTGRITGFRPYADLTDGQLDAPPEDRRTGAAMTYTSGTTGRPRGVRRPLMDIDPDTMAESYASFLMLFGIAPGENGVHIVVSPLYHTAVLNFAMNHLHMGDSVVLMEKWNEEETLRLIEHHKVTSTHMVPTQFVRLLGLPDEVKSRYDVSSLRHVIHSAAPCPVEVKRRMLDWWGPVIYEYYAASEGGGTLATPEEWLKHPGTVGRAWPISEIRIVDDDGKACPPVKVGTVYIKMGGYKFEYHKDKKKTDSAWLDDFFTVGDAGYLNEDGYLFLCDRKADMIISGGVNIYPAEIESALINHPKVTDVAVFGIPDDEWGEQVKAVIEPVSGALPGPDLEREILEFAREKIARYKCPRSIDFTDAMPRDPNGKLYKRKLRDPYWKGRDRAI